MTNFWWALYIVVCLGCTVPLIGIAQESEHWRKVQGACIDNTTEKRTIVFEVGSKDYKTSNESVIDVLGQRFGIDFHFRPGQMKEVINGIDPQIGQRVELYYDPQNPWQAVVMKGWSMPVIIFIMVTLLPLLIRCVAHFGMGWNPRAYGNGYDPIANDGVDLF